MTTSPYHALLLAILATLPACAEEGTACLPVAAELSCPAAKDVDKDDLWDGGCSTIRRIIGEGERVDDIDNYSYDEEATPGCCYPVKEVHQNGCAVGRPMRVEQVSLSAIAVHGASWDAGLAHEVSALDPDLRAALVDRWTRAALDEHASIAAFSRVALDLLRQGAPSELLEMAHGAALDELRHARECFAIASALAGRSVAPGRFPLAATVALAPDLATVAAEAALDGCIGETVSALLAREAAAVCRDPEIRAVLLGIADDEERHALLAWRTVAWALRTGGPEVRTAVEAVFTTATRDGVTLQTLGECDDTAALARVGLLDRTATHRCAARTLRHVILPAARALLAGSHAPATSELSA